MNSVCGAASFQIAPILLGRCSPRARAVRKTGSPFLGSGKKLAGIEQRA